MSLIETSRGSAHRGRKRCETFVHSCERSKCRYRHIVRVFFIRLIVGIEFIMNFEAFVKDLSKKIEKTLFDVIVCRLRLGLLNEQMKDSEIGVTGDETFNDVVRDFSQLACSHPERLQRRNESSSLNNATEWYYKKGLFLGFRKLGKNGIVRFW